MLKTVWICLMSVLLLAGSARAETIVIAATGAGDFAPGSRIEPGQSISLTEGARLTLLSHGGEMQVIKGPYEGAPVAAEAVKVSEKETGGWFAVLALVGDPDARSDVMGTSRKTDGAFLTPPGVWHLSIDSAGPRCTKAGKALLWRRDAEQETTLSVRSDAGRLTNLVFLAGTHVLPLPEDFAADGKLVVSIDGTLRDLDLAVAPQGLHGAAPGKVFSWLMDNKCSRQALVLIERVHAGLGVGD
jgi:hypothetical protein